MRWLLLCSLVPLFACTYTPPDADGTPLADIGGSYLTVVHATPFESPRVSGAIVIARDLAVTTAHGVEGARRSMVVVKDGVRHPATLRARSRTMDIAVLHVPGIPFPDIRIARARPGLRVWSMGTTYGRPPVAAGVIEDAAARACPEDWTPDRGLAACDDRDGLMLRAPGGVGYSGGPVVDAQGRLVGIVAKHYLEGRDAIGISQRDGRKRLFAYRIDDVIAELSDLLEGQQMAFRPSLSTEPSASPQTAALPAPDR